jgi:hypothetical protein
LNHKSGEGQSGRVAEGRAGLGGFGIESDLSCDFTGAIGTAIGYRAFDVDYPDGGFVDAARQQGWELG